MISSTLISFSFLLISTVPIVKIIANGIDEVAGYKRVKLRSV